ncbi:hypothetical protein [Duganella sp. BJB476]|uniref:hypothetical protein n=1 Tax=Duganella sp. BJB476 TaxID=1871176 RepID=UPI000E350C31|nr:hypothetical protein [Duganella sp. BJB476]RFP36162.1 hypothetical protein D0T21_06930 [Duganella sp. BJB476]
MFPLFMHYINMTTRTRRKPKSPPPPADYHSYQLHQPAVDLFGEVPVTDDDLYDWVASVSPVHTNERGYALYVQRYDVAGKVRAAKLARTFDAITARRPPPYHARLALQAIM